jgi:putative phosphoribosyl transferase
MERNHVRIRSGTQWLSGNLTLPQPARGMVLFAHGSGSSRLSPRNRFVAGVLNRGGLGTLLVDLLTEEEERVDSSSGELRFDIYFLTNRLLEAASWIARQGLVGPGCGLGLFGASTGAAAALVTASKLGSQIGAVVSRGGRPDLAGAALSAVTAPTLLIVGGQDVQVLQLNQRALELLGGAKRLDVVPRATHLFEERGALERVAVLARDWLLEYLMGAQVSLPGGETARPG